MGTHFRLWVGLEKVKNTQFWGFCTLDGTLLSDGAHPKMSCGSRLGHRIFSTHRMITSSVSDDRYDHNKASQCKWEVIWTSQKFSTALQSPVFTSKCYSFWLLWAYKVIIKSKKWVLTHVWHDKIWSTENFWEVHITSHLLCDALLWSYLSSETNRMIIRHVEQILLSQTWASGHFQAHEPVDWPQGLQKLNVSKVGVWL